MRQISEITNKKQAWAELCLMNEELKRQQEELEELIRKARAVGTSWETIGNALDLSKQTAYNRYNGITAKEPSKILAEDRAGTSVTPSIFLEAPAPAKKKAAPKKTSAATANQGRGFRKSYLLPGEPPKQAQPGTGKGPHACPSCNDTNHHGSAWGMIAFLPECVPTRYDPQATHDYMNGLTK